RCIFGGPTGPRRHVSAPSQRERTKSCDSTSVRPAAVACALVTENVVDFVPERDIVLVYVLNRNLTSGGAQAASLAETLDVWARTDPDPCGSPSCRAAMC